MDSLQASSSRSTPSGSSRARKDASEKSSAPIARNGSGRYKDKFHALREKYDSVNARHEEIYKQLEAAEYKAGRIQDEIDLLLDALLLAADTNPTLEPSLARLAELDDALSTPAPPATSSSLVAHYPPEPLPPLPNGHRGAYVTERGYGYSAEDEYEYAAARARAQWEEEEAEAFLGYAPQAGAVTYTPHSPPPQLGRNGSSRGHPVPPMNGDRYAYEYDERPVYYNERSPRQPYEHSNGHGHRR